jgi:peroxiredoxin
MRKRLLTLGEPAPWFSAPTTANANFHFDTVAGRYVVLCFFESAARPDSRRILDDLWQRRERFSDDEVTFFGISHDPLDQQQARVQEQIPGLRFFWDFGRAVSQGIRSLATRSGNRPSEVRRAHGGARSSAAHAGGDSVR